MSDSGPENLMERSINITSTVLFDESQVRLQFQGYGPIEAVELFGESSAAILFSSKDALIQIFNQDPAEATLKSGHAVLKTKIGDYDVKTLKRRKNKKSVTVDDVQQNIVDESVLNTSVLSIAPNIIDQSSMQAIDAGHYRVDSFFESTPSKMPDIPPLSVDLGTPMTTPSSTPIRLFKNSQPTLVEPPSASKSVSRWSSLKGMIGKNKELSQTPLQKSVSTIQDKTRQSQPTVESGLHVNTIIDRSSVVRPPSASISTSTPLIPPTSTPTPLIQNSSIPIDMSRDRRRSEWAAKKNNLLGLLLSRPSSNDVSNDQISAHVSSIFDRLSSSSSSCDIVLVLKICLDLIIELKLQSFSRDCEDQLLVLREIFTCLLVEHCKYPCSQLCVSRSDATRLVLNHHHDDNYSGDFLLKIDEIILYQSYLTQAVSQIDSKNNQGDNASIWPMVDKQVESIKASFAQEVNHLHSTIAHLESSKSDLLSNMSHLKAKNVILEGELTCCRSTIEIQKSRMELARLTGCEEHVSIIRSQEMYIASLLQQINSMKSNPTDESKTDEVDFRYSSNRTSSHVPTASSQRLPLQVTQSFQRQISANRREINSLSKSLGTNSEEFNDWLSSLKNK